jgi:hypothetical protein
MMFSRLSLSLSRLGQRLLVGAAIASIAIWVLSGFMFFSTTVYVSQAGGAFTGGSACNGQTAISVATYNASGSTYGAGSTVILCGTITTAIAVPTGGASGNPLTVRFDLNANMTSAAWNLTAFSSGGNNWIVLDGGSNGIIQNTANGTVGAFANQRASVGVDFSGSSNATIENLTIANIYQRTANSTTDDSTGANDNRCIFWLFGSPMTVNNVTTHDCRFNLYEGNTTESGISITNSIGWNQAAHWWIAPGNSGSTLSNVTYAHNSFRDPAPKWDSPGVDIFHMDGIHQFCQPSSTCSGLFIYANYFSGDWGEDYTAQIFTENGGGTQANQKVYNNIVDNSATSASTQSSNGQIDVQMGANGLLANNTIIGSSNISGVGLQIIDGTNVTQKNIVIEHFNYMEVTLSGTSFVGGGLNNNVYFDASNWFQYQGTGTGDFPGWQSATGQDGGSQVADPNLNASTYVPNVGSPTIAAGANLTSLGLSALDVDFNGNARPGSGNWTIGAVNPGGSIGAPGAPAPSMFAAGMLARARDAATQ